MTTAVAPTATTEPPKTKRPPWWIAGVLATLAFVVATVTVFVNHLDTEPQPRPTAVTAPPSPGVYPGEEAMTGTELLNAMADRIAVLPDDTRTGSYELMHNIVWGTEIQGPIYAVDQQTWHLPDGTARYAIQRSRTLPAQGFDPLTASLDFTGARQLVQDSVVDKDLTDSPDITLPAGGDPAAQLDWYLTTQRHGQTASTDVHIQELVSVYHQQLVLPRLRAAILRLLAQLPVAFTHQRVSDRLHREGIAFRPTEGRDTTLIFDPVTGALNAVHEQFHGRLFAYTLFYPTVWTDHRGPDKPQPTPISTIRPTQTAWPDADDRSPIGPIR